MSFRPGAKQFFERRGAPTPPLPYDAEVEYLESTGKQYIELLFGFDNTDEVHTSFSISELTDDKFMVSTKTWNTNNNRFGMGGGRKYQCGYGSYQTGSTFLSPQTYNDNTIRLWNYAGRIFSVPSLGISLDCASIPWGGTTTQIRLFFGYNAPSRGKMASYHHVKSGNDVADLIPVRFTNEQRVSEGAMYDRVSGQLFRNAGTGAFTIGPDKS